MSPRPELINAERGLKAEVGDEHRIKREERRGGFLVCIISSSRTPVSTGVIYSEVFVAPGSFNDVPRQTGGETIEVAE